MIVSSMIRMYCKYHHRSGKTVCQECNSLQQYAAKRLNNCRFGDLKPVCKECVIHCYSPREKERMRTVMRWAGPRMLYLHPLYAIIHLIDSRKSGQTKPINTSV
jgi:hypothetical protein